VPVSQSTESIFANYIVVGVRYLLWTA